MLQRLRRAAFLPVALFTAVLAVAALQRSATAEGNSGQCPRECGTKIEQAPWAITGDRVVISVCIKAGTQLISFSEDGTDGCYTVTGIGTPNVTVTGGGTSRYCKDISNVVFYYDCDGGGGGAG